MNVRKLLSLRGWLPALLLVVGLRPAAGQSTLFSDPERVREYSTRYHVVRTDLDVDDAREALLRLSMMAQEYAERTRGFSGRLDRQLPLYLFRHETDYFDAGGIPETSGLFDGTRLLVVAGKKAGPATWHTLQHEGFHQFASATIHRSLPIWVNEGLAEYFGEAVFTGDGYVTGGVPQWRLKRVREAIAEGQFVPLGELLRMTPEAWNAQIDLTRYDQAWAIVQFLAHADSGRYRKRFVGYINDLSRGTDSATAWRNRFGSDDQGLTRRFITFWSDLPEDHSATHYATAATRTITLFMARAEARGLAPDSVELLAAMLLDGRIRLEGDDWLPTSLLLTAISQGSAHVTWRVDRGGRQTLIVGTLKSGATVIGQFALRGTVIEGVGVRVDQSPVLLARARDAMQTGNREQALALYKRVLAADPPAETAEEARLRLQEMLRSTTRPSSLDAGAGSRK